MIKRFESGKRMSQAIVYNGHFATAGQVASNPSADILGQTEQVLGAIDRLLNEANFTRNDLTQVQIWLSDIEDFSAVNVVYERWLEGFTKPVRACVESNLAGREYLVEIQAFAYRGA
uniref:RidA family protein n=1 Tax=Cupriavidus necator TaxID=106590 RepID=UPI003F491DF4